MSLTFDRSPSFLSSPRSKSTQRDMSLRQQQESSMAHLAQMNGNLSVERTRAHESERRLCQRITFVTALVLIPVVVLRRLIGNGPANTFSGERLSIFAEARADASAVIPYIFMG